MSLQIGKAIYDILSNDSDVVDRVQNKIYPLIADVDTTFPFIVYKRTGIAPADSKDRFVFDEDVFVDTNDVWDDGDRVGITILPKHIRLSKL